MIIPWKVDVPQDRWPFVNWLIIVAIIGVFVLQVVTFVAQVNEEQIVEGEMGQFVLDGWGLKGLFGHMWLHGGLFHLIGNLLFLWIFGNAVCAKIGNLYYLPIYLLVGVFSGVTHLLFQDGAVIGASGAINGIVGMYLIFFPENSITCYLMLFVPIEFKVRSLWVVLMWLVFDMWGAVEGRGNVAYFAHIGGFVAGFGAAFLFLKTGWIKMERYEKSLVQLLKDWRQPEKEQGGFDPRYRGLQRELEDMGYAEREKDEMPEDMSMPDGRGQSEAEGFAAEDSLEEEFIRFSCSCGKRVKVPMKYAGKRGRCPRCKKQLKIPGGPPE